MLTESDTDSSLVTTFTVTPGGASRVRISTTWEGAGGIGGFFERLFAPRVMRGLYADELERLNSYARERATATAPEPTDAARRPAVASIPRRRTPSRGAPGSVRGVR